LSLEWLSNVENNVLQELDVLWEGEHADGHSVHLDGFQDEILDSINSSGRISVTRSSCFSPELEAEVLNKWSNNGTNGSTREHLSFFQNFFSKNQESSLSVIDFEVQNQIQEPIHVFLLILGLQAYQIQIWQF
jgi:hypothetical protein